MKKQRHIRVDKNPRKFPCDTVSAPLIAWLNAMPDSDLHCIVRDLQSLDALAEKLNWYTLREEEKPTWLEFERLKNSINLRMRQFATYPAIITDSLFLPAQARGIGKPVEFPVKFRRTFSLHGDDGPDRYKLARRGYQYSADPETAVFEFHQIRPFLALEEIVKKKLVSRLKQCATCGKWFCGRSWWQACCSSPCRQGKYQASPKGKAKRQEYLKLKKSGKTK